LDRKPRRGAAQAVPPSKVEIDAALDRLTGTSRTGMSLFKVIVRASQARCTAAF
jgi:hypothetical protein